jgi:uncharacterized membrane protein
MLHAKKGTGAHKTLGWIWVAAMAVAVFSALFIHGFEWIGPFSPIHLLIPFAARGVWSGIAAARNRQVASHREHMLWMYWAALGIPLALALLPGRRLNMMLLGDEASLVPTILLAIVLTSIGAYFKWERQLKNLRLLNKQV